MESIGVTSVSLPRSRDDWDNEDDNSTSVSFIQTVVQVESTPAETTVIPENHSHSPAGGENIWVPEPNTLESQVVEGRAEGRERLASLNVGRLHRQSHPAKSMRNAFSLETKLDAEESGEEVRERLKSLISEFSRRAKRKKEKIRRPVTPSSEELSSDDPDGDKTEKQLRERMDELFPTSTESSTMNVFALSQGRRKNWMHHLLLGRFWSHCQNLNRIVLDAQSYNYISWLLIVAACFLYNAWLIPFRIVFPVERNENELYWLCADGLVDFIYALDTLVIKARIKYIQDGFWVKDPKQVRAYYFRSFKFKIGLISIFPLDLIMMFFFERSPWFRILRFIKVETFWELFRRFDSVLSSPHPVRIARSILHMLYLIHIYASAYYALSSWERDAGYTTDWMFVMEDKTMQVFFGKFLESYIRCFYFATKTATSIGKNPKPENEIEYLFMTCAWLSGVFAFAILIGQIRDVIATATRNQTEYRQLLYATVNYLRRFDVPKHLQERVKLWLTYTWQQQKTLDESNILALLPAKMQADLALHVHIQMLNTVKLFQHCEAAFLRDLVPRLKSIIFLPGDFVCRKYQFVLHYTRIYNDSLALAIVKRFPVYFEGEVGKEMYIVKSGRVDVIGGNPGNEKLLASLTAGSVFGEIALLQIDGMDKRTADVRSAGFSNLFVLLKRDIQEVIKDYPAAQDSLKKQAKQLMREKQRRESCGERREKNTKDFSTTEAKNDDVRSNKSDNSDVIIKEPAKSQHPKLLDTVLQAMPIDSKTSHYIQYGFKSIAPPAKVAHEINLDSYPPSPFLSPTSAGFGNIRFEIHSSTEDLSGDTRL